MKVWLQRVTEAAVTIDGVEVARIGRGYLALLGITERITKIRIFEDENGKTNKSIQDVNGSVIVVSQFTLYADTAHGRRPGFSNAARPDLAEPLYERVVGRLRELLGPDKVSTGRFGDEMQVSLVNDGPFSVELLA